jgi:tripartite-type tricarboxylate transporter receptor subunit TctC
MKMKLLVAAAAWLTAFYSFAADVYPSKPVTLIVAYAPGGMTDILTRKLAVDLQKTFGQTFIVENKAGATGQIATDYVARRPADGYTLLIGATSHVINPALKKSLPYNARTAFDPVALLAVSPNFVLVHPQVKVDNFAALAEYGKRHGAIPYGTAGAGGAPHIVGEKLRVQSGLPLTHVSYKGAGPAMNDLIGGQIPFGISESVTANAYLKTGRVKPIAIASAQRSKLFPDVPTLNELGYKGFDLSTWVGVYAPAGTPEPILTRLNVAMQDAINKKDLREYIQSTGSDAGKLSLADYRKFVSAEMDKWQAVITEIGLKDE